MGQLKGDEMGGESSTHRTEVKLTRPPHKNMKEKNCPEGIHTHTHAHAPPSIHVWTDVRARAHTHTHTKFLS